MGQCILNVGMIKFSVVKLLVEGLAGALENAVVKFSRGGVRVIAKHIFVHLDAGSFDYYRCDRNIYIRLDLLNLQNIVNLLNVNDMVSFFMDTDNLNFFGINIVNDMMQTQTIYHLNLLELDYLQFHMADSPNDELEKMCSDMQNMHLNVEK